MQSDIFVYMDSSTPAILEGGPLTGKRVAVQPNMSVRGWPTEAGSVALKGFVALEDATVVERLRQAGAAIAGSIRMSELGFGLVGDTGARALAEGQADIVLMTDMMGEARVAAAAIGAFGFKPSYGIISRFGLIGLVPSMESFGILANSPEEIAAVMRVIAGRDDRDFSMSECKTPDFSQVREDQEPMRGIGVVRECVETLDPEESRAFRETLCRMEEAGLKVQEVCLGDFDLLRAVHNVIGSVEASSSSGKYDGVRYGHRTAGAKDWNEMYLRSRAESFGLLLKTYLFQGAYFQFENYAAFEKACALRARLLEETEALFKKVDALAFPAIRQSFPPSKANTIQEIYETCALTLFANVTGQPAIVVPGFVLAEAGDLGLQIAGPHLSDSRLLSFASRLTNSAEGVR